MNGENTVSESKGGSSEGGMRGSKRARSLRDIREQRGEMVESVDALRAVRNLGSKRYSLIVVALVETDPGKDASLRRNVRLEKR